jgi:hypothetical protein
MFYGLFGAVDAGRGGSASRGEGAQGLSRLLHRRQRRRVRRQAVSLDSSCPSRIVLPARLAGRALTARPGMGWTKKS